MTKEETQVIDCQIRIIIEGSGEPVVKVTPLWETAQKIAFDVSKVEKNSFALGWELKDVKRNK